MVPGTGAVYLGGKTSPQSHSFETASLTLVRERETLSTHDLAALRDLLALVALGTAVVRRALRGAHRSRRKANAPIAHSGTVCVSLARTA